MAKDVPHPDTLELNTTWKELFRIISNLEANVCKYTYMLVVVYKIMHVIGMYVCKNNNITLQVQMATSYV